MESCHFERGDQIIKQNDVADAMFIVVDGEVVVVREEGGESRTLTTCSTGDYFGERGLVAVL